MVTKLPALLSKLPTIASPARLVSGLGFVSAVLALVVWFTGKPDARSLLLGDDRIAKIDKRLEEEIDTLQRPSDSSVCDLTKELCLSGTLTSESGTKVELGSTGHITLLALGSTTSSCRYVAENVDILTKAISGFLPAKGYYIAADPRTDSPSRIAEFKSHHRLAIQVLSGEDASLREVARRLRLFYSPGLDSQGLPFLDHPTIILIFDREGRNIGHIPGKNSQSLEDNIELLVKTILGAKPKSLRHSSTSATFLKVAAPTQSTNSTAGNEQRALMLNAIRRGDYSTIRKQVQAAEKARTIKRC